MRKNGFFLLAPLPLLLQACGSAVPESDGLLTLQGSEPVVIRDPDQQKAICEAQYCEPNYLLYSSFAKKRPPSVITRPAPSTPTPVPEVDQAPVVPPAFFGDSDLYDYAKENLKVREAWSYGEGASVVVADIDSGIDLTHPDLVSNLWTNPGESESNPGMDHDGNGLPNDVHGFDFYAGKGSPTDENGHGTHTAGTIGALRNGKGVIGVAPQVKIMALRFLGPEGQGTTEGAIRAIRYAVRMGARVISASWGGSGFSSLLAQAVNDAVEAGVVFVAAAGNEGRDIDRLPVYPAAYPGAIAVAASDPFDRLTSFSNYGAGKVWIAAPGERIVSTYPGGSYASLSGTSMATPHVAGAVALKLGQNRSLTPAVVKTLLCSSADRAGITGTRCGRMNVARLLAN